jgi:ubiquinone/menaquinone biosynthesis C-methylase UbiE
VPERNQTLETTGAVIHWAARYDLLVWLLTLGRESAFREKVIRLARLEPGEAVLDVGCGTGTLAIAAKRHVGPHGSVDGIDPSPEMISRAEKKAAKAGATVGFKEAVAEALPFPDAAFDAALASVMLHHLPRDARRQCLNEIRRVLKPGGRLLAVDFIAAKRERHGLIAHLHGHTRFDLRDVIPVMGDAGLEKIESGTVGFGGLHYVLAEAPGVP